MLNTRLNASNGVAGFGNSGERQLLAEYGSPPNVSCSIEQSVGTYPARLSFRISRNGVASSTWCSVRIHCTSQMQ
jgi:hypothetical protein